MFISDVFFLIFLCSLKKPTFLNTESFLFIYFIFNIQLKITFSSENKASFNNSLLLRISSPKQVNFHDTTYHVEIPVFAFEPHTYVCTRGQKNDVCMHENSTLLNENTFIGEEQNSSTYNTAQVSERIKFARIWQFAVSLRLVRVLKAQ